MRRQWIRGWVVAPGLLILSAAIASGQDESAPLQLKGLFPVGARHSVTEAWGTLQFTVENRGDTAKQVRVVVFYPSRSDLRYARDVWVPARAQRSSWLSVGPAPDESSTRAREIAYQLFDRTDGTDRPVRGRDPERVLTRAVSYDRREPTTALYLDSPVVEADGFDPLDDRTSADSESLQLARTARRSRGLSERVALVREQSLPPVAEALDGVDLFVVAGNQLAADPPGRQALRHWVLGGGTLWVLLDRVEPDVVAPILGDALRFQVVGRTGLTTLHLRGAQQDRAQSEEWTFDRPVELVRVALSGSETLLSEANDWPAAFSQSVGRGRVIFTTLGARGWYGPRTPRDPRARPEADPDSPVARGALDALSLRLYPERETEGFRVEDLAPMLAAEIGYEVVGRRTAGVILAAFLAGLVAVAIALRRTRAPELIGFAGPAVALAAAAAFAIAATHSRDAVPSTAAAVAVVSISPDNHEEEWRGLFAVYNPRSGPVELSAAHGGRVAFDRSGLEGAAHRRAETDLDAWHWENLSFPAGVRVGPFQSTARARAAAVARFGAMGLDGRLSLGACRTPADAVLQTRAGALLGVRLNADGSFRLTSDDRLPADQYLSGPVLTDRQQRRQDLYRRFFTRSKPAPGPDQDRLFVWAETDDLPFAVPGAARTVGTVLLVVPLQYESGGAGSVTVPSGFVPFAAIIDGRSFPPRLEHSEPTRMRLRFQLPAGLDPFTVERAVLQARIRAPGRKFSVFGLADGQPVPVQDQFAPAKPIRVEITDPRLLRTDPGGGLFLELAVSERLGPDGRENPVTAQDQLLMWTVEALGLEVTGRVGAK